MYLSAKLTNKSYVEIGKFFDRHHATVIHALHKLQEDLTKKGENTRYYQEVKSLYEKLKELGE